MVSPTRGDGASRLVPPVTEGDTLTKLNQVLAIEKGVKERNFASLTKAHHMLLKTEQLKGLSRTYMPLDDDGEKFPSETKVLQIRTDEVIRQIQGRLCELFDVTAARDYANCKARADVVVERHDGEPLTLLTDVPATYLLWMEKRLIDLRTFVTKLPVLPPDETWEFDDNTDSFKSAETKTAKTKKLPVAFLKAAATKEHPAQVEVVFEDKLQGYWTIINYNGGLPKRRIAEMTERVESLLKAVKFAREKANGQDVQTHQIGDKVLGFIFG